MKLHKLFALLLVVVLLLSLCACSKTASPAVTTEPTTEPVVTTTTPETTVPTTTVPHDPNGWIIDEDMRDYTDTIKVFSAFKLTQGMQELVTEFNTYYPNITVEWHTYTNQAVGGMHINTLLCNGEVDVVYSFGINYTAARWKDNLFMDITDKLAAEGIDLVENWGTDVYSYNDRYYSIPCGGVQYYVAINKTAWEEAELGAIPTEWTWDAYIEASRKMTKTNEDGTIRYGGSSFSSINTMMYCVAQVTGGDIYFNTDVTASNYDDSIAIKAFEREIHAELIEKIWFPVKTYRDETLQSYQTFLTGQVASTVTINVVRNLTDAEFDATSDFITAFAPFPTEEAGQTNYMAGVHTYSHIAIAEKSEHKEASWLFVKFAATYGAKYLAVAGHHSTWRGTTADDVVQAVFGSEENAAQYVDVESFKNAIGRTDLPAFRENVSENAIKAYSKVTAFLKDPLMKALQGELTAEEAMKEAAEGANAYIKDALYDN